MGGLKTTAASVTLEGVWYTNCLNFSFGAGWVLVCWLGGRVSE